MKPAKSALLSILSVVFVLLFAERSFSQDFKLKLPELLPPSPEVSSLIQAGYGNVNRNTGAVSLSIPIYEININGFSWPIGLSYSSQGLKIDEACSRVGNGWTLNANGVISRNVKDEPDDVSVKLPVPVSLGSVDTATLNYAYNVAGSFDSEYDIYHFSFNGYSGKMVFNDSNQAIVTAHNNLKIERSGWHTFTITATDGVKYFFGGEYERTITHNMDIATGYKNNTRTAYFLTRVELPGGGWINFNYSELNMSSRTGTSQTITRTAGKVEDPCLVCPAWGSDTFSEQISYVEYKTRLLTSITSSAGHLVSFSYQSKPDLSGDQRLTSINVLSSFSPVKYLQLSYYDPPGFTGSTTQTSRYFLSKLSQLPITGEGVNGGFALEHNFTYHDLANLGGTPFSREQDYFGFYNGNTGNLLTAEGPFAASVQINGNRTPNPELAKKGILTSVKYPTGGYEVFDYEPNTLPLKTVHNYPKAEINMFGFYQNAGQLSYTYSSSIFNVPFSQTVPVNLTSYDSDGVPDYTSVERIVQFYIKRDGDTLIHEWMNGNDSRQLQVIFDPGHSYQILMRIRNDQTNGGAVNLAYDTTTATYSTYSNEITGGLRLRKISYLDKAGSVAKKKFFKYAPAGAIADALSQGTLLITQGNGHRRAYFTAEAFNSIWCEDELASYAVCKMNVLSTNSSYNTHEFEGSNIYYSVIVESDDSLYANGCTEYNYFAYDAATNNETLRGTDVTATAMGNFGTKNNMLESVKQYDKNFSLVSEQTDDYEGVGVPGKALYSYFVQQKYQPILNSPNLLREVDAFNIVRYRHWDRWIRKVSTVSKRYEGGQVIIDTVKYVYGTPANVLPAQTITYSSKGQQLKTTQTYPTDAPGTGVFPAMIAANQIAAPYETNFLVNNVLQQQKQIKYKNIHSALFVPDTVRLKAMPAAALTDEQYFRVYDSAGNPVQFNKVSDVSMVYLWDHSKRLVTAQVVNAQLSQVAYSSFEGDSWGNWKPQPGAQINLDGGYTGKRSFTGSLRDTLSVAGIYTVTAWSNSGTPSVNSTAGTSVVTKNGWTLYKWTFSNPTIIAITGTRIDEVRLYPSTAQMATVTHTPDIGVSAKCDVNNKVMRYEYDGFNRLHLIRDEDNNILKQICYNYAGQPEECGAAVYYSIAKSGTFTRNNCGTNGTGASITYTVAAGTYTSTVDQATADQLAQDAVNANGQAYANANAGCTWTNQQQSSNFTRNNCGTNGTGTTVTYTVNAGTYSSTTSLADANQQAVNYINANGQAYANTNGTCSWTNQQQSSSFTRNNCGTNGTGGTMTYTVNAGTYTSTTSLADANQQAINYINANGQNYVNANAGCTWTNQAQSGNFTRNNCATNYIGTTVTYTIAAGTYSSTTSLAHANTLAVNAVNSGGQAYANANGTCVVDCASTCIGYDKKCIDNVCTTGTAIEIDCEFDPETNKYKHWFAYRFPDGSWSAYTYYVIRPDGCSVE